jgi:hypothetical protein
LLGLSGLPKEATQLFASTNALHAGMRCGLLFGLPIWRPKPPSFAPRGLDGARPAHILNLPLIVGTEHQGADMPEIGSGHGAPIARDASTRFRKKWGEKLSI